MNVRVTESCEIAVVGAGLVGSLLAIFLARRGHRVKVYERRADMRTQSKAEGRSINLAISCRGIHALSKVNLAEEALQEAIPMHGRMMHAVSGALTFQRYGLDDTQSIHSISRSGLNRLLLERAEKDFGVEFCFGRKLTAVDFDENILEFQTEGGSQGVRAQVIFGTDGAASVIRRTMSQFTGFYSDESDLGTAYKELAILDENGRHRLEKNALHIWPRGNFMLIALPNHDGSFTCTLFLPLEGAISFARLRSPDEVVAFFETHFPDSLALLHELPETFFANPTGHLTTVKCFPWCVAERQTLLLGDAAHAIIPFFGQGMNCGFEDCEVLDALVEEESKAKSLDWKTVFSRFEMARKPRADAIAELSRENFVEMRDHVGNAQFLLEKKVEKILEEKFSGQYVSRYSMVSFSQIPYDQAYRIGEVQKTILKDLCQKLSQADDVDLQQAEMLIRERLVPLMRATS